METSRTLLAVVIIFLIPSILIDFLVISENDYINFFGNTAPPEMVEELIKKTYQWKSLGYLLNILFIVAKPLLVGCILWLGVFLSNKKQPFNSIWQITLWAQLVFAIKSYILFIHALITTDFGLEGLKTFNPLSIASLFKTSTNETYWLFLLQSLNLFEITYWFVLAYLLARLLKTSLNEGLKLTLSSYVPAFGLWLLVITFFLISNS